LDKDFGQRIEAAALRLRQCKDEKVGIPLVPLEAYMQPCQSCERYPASEVVLHQPLCAACAAKRRAADKEQSAPEDLETLGESSHPKGYIGFIYLDGNNMGDRLRGMESLKNYQEFAKDLDLLINSAVEQALSKHSHQDHKKYDKFLIGGDDAMLVTTADICLPVALEIGEWFESHSREVLANAGLPTDRPLTLGIGVVIAHASFPIAAFNKLANQLLKKAKQRSAELNYVCSALDFMVVTAAGSADVGSLRDDTLSEKVFAFPHKNIHASLTRRPYTLADAKLLLEFSAKFKRQNFPRNQLQYLYEGLFHSQVEAIYRWGLVTGRIKKGHRQLMEEFKQQLLGRDTELPPWKPDINYRGETYYVTTLGDLVEIYPFIYAAREEKANAANED
jgi:CRISPR-associated protein Cmr2